MPVKRFEYERLKMAVPVRVVLYAETETVANACAETAYKRFDEINASMSDYDPSSEILQLGVDNDLRFRKDSCCDDGWRGVSDDLFSVLRYSRHYAEISDGAFDATVSPLVQLWRRARRLRKMPGREEIENARSLVGSHLWELGGNSGTEKQVRLHRAKMRFDFGGIAKGYAVDQAFEAICAEGIRSVLVDAGGDMRLGVAPPGEDGWNVAMVTGRQTDTEGSMIHKTLANISVASSGDTFQYFEVDGKRYSHIIDPKTGMPLADSCLVTVLTDTATESDALASAVSVLGPQRGISLIDRIPGCRAMVVSPTEPPTFFYSKAWS
ncbi:MAG: FAD:protein FMN transferase [Planctomycetaceae bacterium]|nr:FAD:protein FMN transferase [Planctomycetaceae bacterium]